MKNIFIISCLTLVCACQNAISATNRNPDLAQKAYHYYGLSESKDRKLIKELTGVDPIIGRAHV